MHRNARVITIGLILTLVLVLPVCVYSMQALTLLTFEEARELQLDDAEWEAGSIPKSVGIGIGPKIVFENPIVQTTDNGLLIASKSTMDLVILFEDGLSPVDMESLKVKARKGWFSKSLTKRLKPYLQGNSIRAEKVKIPSGRFKLEIKIADTSGTEVLQEYLCEIKD